MTFKNKAFDWDGYLSLARQFLQELELDNTDSNENESKVRCGISRAYYAAFNGSKKFLHSIGIDPQIFGDRSHERIINEFKMLYENSDDKNRDKPYIKIYNDLSSLKVERIKADYNDYLFTESFLSQNAKKNKLETAIKHSEKIVENLSLIQAARKNIL